MVWERIARNAPHSLVGDQLAQFRTMDLDGNGVVDYQELAAVLRVVRFGHIHNVGMVKKLGVPLISSIITFMVP